MHVVLVEDGLLNAAPKRSLHCSLPEVNHSFG